MEYLQHDCDVIFERIAAGNQPEPQQQQEQDSADEDAAAAGQQQQQQRRRGSQATATAAAAAAASAGGGPGSSGYWGFGDIDLSEPYDITLRGPEGLTSFEPPSRLGSQSQGFADSGSQGLGHASSGVLARGGSVGSWGLVGGTQPEVFEDWEDEEGLGAFDLTELEVLALRTTSGTGITNAADSTLHAAGTEGSAGQQQQQQQQQGREGVGNGDPETNTPSAAAAADEYDQQQQQQQQQFSESVGAAATGGGCHPSGSDDAAVDWMSHPEDDVMAAVSDGHHDDVIDGMSHPSQDDVTSLSPCGGVELEGEGAAVAAAAAAAAAAIATPPPSPPPQEPLTVRQGKKRPLEPSAAAVGSEGDSEGEQLLPFHIPGEDQQQQQRQQRRRVLTELFGEPTPLMTDDDVSKNRVSHVWGLVPGGGGGGARPAGGQKGFGQLLPRGKIRKKTKDPTQKR